MIISSTRDALELLKIASKKKTNDAYNQQIFDDYKKELAEKEETSKQDRLNNAYRNLFKPKEDKQTDVEPQKVVAPMASYDPVVTSKNAKDYHKQQLNDSIVDLTRSLFKNL